MTMSTSAARQQVAEAGRRLVADGLVEGTAGNVSVRAGDLVAISPSSVPYEQIGPDDVCVLHRDGTPVAGFDTYPPSSESPLHLAVYAHTDAGAIVHHHGRHSTAVSTVVTELPPLHYYAIRLGGPTRVAPYATYGTPELAASVAGALEDRTAALMSNHGAIAYGRTLEEAYDRAQLLEWLCSVHIAAHSLGTPRVLSTRQLDDVAQRRIRGAAG